MNFDCDANFVRIIANLFQVIYSNHVRQDGKKEASMQQSSWVHLPFRRGVEMVRQHDEGFILREQPGDAISAWGLILSNDGFTENARVAGIAFIGERREEKLLEIHIGWIERSADTRGRRSRMVADLAMLAWARWMDAQRIFLCGRRGNGIALTREMSNQEGLVVRWAMGRMRATSGKRGASAPLGVQDERGAFGAQPPVNAKIRDRIARYA